MGSRFIHFDHDIVHIKLCRFQARRKVQESFQEILRDTAAALIVKEPGLRLGIFCLFAVCCDEIKYRLFSRFPTRTMTFFTKELNLTIF